MSPRTIATIAAASLGLTGVVFAFLQNASPYATVAQAKTIHSDSIHVAGSIQVSSLIVRPASRVVRFNLVDAAGDVMPVDYQGAAPANIDSATRVVAIGGFHGDTFEAKSMLLKCPSRYEQEQPTFKQR